MTEPTKQPTTPTPAPLHRVIADPKDPKEAWELAQSSDYTPYTFYTRSTDGKGHYEQVNTKVSRGFLAQLQWLISKGDMPMYRSVQDFMRDAMIHRLRFLHDNMDNPQLRKITFGAEVDGLIATQRAVEDEQQQVIERAHQRFVEMSRQGDQQGIADLVEALETFAGNALPHVRREAESLVVLYRDMTAWAVDETQGDQ